MGEFVDTRGPTVLPVAPSDAGGFVIGVLAKKALPTKMLLTGSGLRGAKGERRRAAGIGWTRGGGGSRSTVSVAKEQPRPHTRAP